MPFTTMQQILFFCFIVYFHGDSGHKNFPGSNGTTPKRNRREERNNCQFKKNPQPVHELWKKAVEFVLILGRLGALELQLKPVCNQCDKLTIGGLPLGIAHGIAKEALQGVQVSPVPGDLDGVANGPLYP